MNKEVWETWPNEVVRDMMRAMLIADDKYSEDGAASTKTYIRDYYIPALAELGLKVIHENKDSSEVINGERESEL